MSFAAPLVLLGLLVLPALAVWYAQHQRDRARAAAAFAAPALTASVAPHRPGWRRHVPMLVFGLAIAVLIVAAARPRTTVAVPVERASIMLATDVSGSMLAKDVPPTRLAAARAAARRFVDRVPAKVNVGVLAFNQRPSILQSPTRDREEVAAAIAAMHSSGGTATGEAIQAAVRSLTRARGANGKRIPGAIVLISDGASTKGVDPVTAAQAAKRAGIRVYTVALGTPQGTITVPRASGQGSITRNVPPDPESLKQIATASGGEAFTADDADGLNKVYERLGSQLGRKNEKREITAGFAGGGLVILLLGAGLSLGWFGRLI